MRTNIYFRILITTIHLTNTSSTTKNLYTPSQNIPQAPFSSNEPLYAFAQLAGAVEYTDCSSAEE